MATQYCLKCGLAAMSTMRICSSCGNRAFTNSPPSSVSNMQSRGAVTPTPFNSIPSAVSPQTLQPLPLRVIFVPARHWRRLFAYLIDYLILGFTAGVIGGIATIVGLGNKSSQGAFSSGLLLLLSAVLPFIYFTYLHSRPSCASWGKSAMGLRLVTTGGERLTPMQAFIRCLVTLLVPVAGWILVGVTVIGALDSEMDALKRVGEGALIIGIAGIILGPYLPVFFNPQRQTLFDLICKTRVISAK
jgi:uncharacterized RDD family membrane protein YckC